MKQKETTKPGWNIPVDIKEQFSSFCSKVGSVAQEDCSGALMIWQYLPPQIRERAKLEAKGVNAIDKEFWEAFCKGVESALYSPDKNQH